MKQNQSINPTEQLPAALKLGDDDDDASYHQNLMSVSSPSPAAPVDDLESARDHLTFQADSPNSRSADPLHPDGHHHFSQRAPWLRALTLGANDGLVSIASLMLGVSAAKYGRKEMVLSGIAGLVAGACSMAIGEFISVFSQRDTELADVEKEKREHAKGPEAEARELEELAQIYVGRGVSYYLAKQVAVELSRGDVIKAHARDELGIDVDELSNPVQAAVASAVAFCMGGAVPLLSGAFIREFRYRLASLIVSSTLALAVFGAIGARLGGASTVKAAVRVMTGGWIAMLLTFGILRLVNKSGL